MPAPIITIIILSIIIIEISAILTLPFLLTSALPLLPLPMRLPRVGSIMLIHLPSSVLPSRESTSSSAFTTVVALSIAELHWDWLILRKIIIIILITISWIHLHEVSGIDASICHGILATLGEVHRIIDTTRILYQDVLPYLVTQSEYEFVKHFFSACTLYMGRDWLK